MAGESIRAAWAERFGRSEPKVVCVGLNYGEHASEQGAAAPDEPLLFAKTASALCGPDEPILLPPEADHVDAEAELVVVIGQTARRISKASALEAVAGYTCANDVSARNLQFGDGQWFRGKSFDTFCPLLPDVVPRAELGDASGLRVVQRLNGAVLQDGNTSDLIFGVPHLVAHVSNVLTLEPGDLILTGTPSGVGFVRKPPVALQEGDVVEVEVEGIGVLRNPVVAEGA